MLTRLEFPCWLAYKQTGNHYLVGLFETREEAVAFRAANKIDPLETYVGNHAYLLRYLEKFEDAGVGEVQVAGDGLTYSTMTLQQVRALPFVHPPSP